MENDNFEEREFKSAIDFILEDEKKREMQRKSFNTALFIAAPPLSIAKLIFDKIKGGNKNE